MAKIRAGFVSNSSSSSFTCDICKNTESGWDASLSDFNMASCEMGHTFCEHHISKEFAGEYDDLKSGNLTKDTVPIEVWKAVKEHASTNRYHNNSTDDEIFDSYASDWRYGYEVPSYYCPLCRLDALSYSDALTFLLTTKGLNMSTLLEEIRSTFDTYENFHKELVNMRKAGHV